MERLSNAKLRLETRYYISSLADVGEIATAMRRHWICENSHWPHVRRVARSTSSVRTGR